MDFIREISELHDLFESHFLGTTDSLDRAAEVLAPNFTIVGPTGSVSDRTQTLQALADGHAHANSLKILTKDHALVSQVESVLVVRYIERHELANTSNERISTVVFEQDANKPNGLTWISVHETWLGQDG